MFTDLVAVNAAAAAAAAAAMVVGAAARLPLGSRDVNEGRCCGVEAEMAGVTCKDAKGKGEKAREGKKKEWGRQRQKEKERKKKERERKKKKENVTNMAVESVCVFIGAYACAQGRQGTVLHM
jgi:hypothetical protein